MLTVGSRPQRGRYGFEIVQRETPSASGFTINMRNETTLLIIDPPVCNLLSGTVNLPAIASDGDVVKVMCTRAVMALTMGALGGVTVVNNPGSIGWGGKHEWVYNVATRSWFCLNGYVGRAGPPPKVAAFTQSNIPINTQPALTLQDGPSAMLVIAPAVASTQLNLMYQNLPAGVTAPFTLTMTWRSGDREWGSGGSGMGMAIRNSSNGRLGQYMAQNTTNAASQYAATYNWTGPTVLTAGPLQQWNTDVPLHGLRLDVTSSAWFWTTGDVDGFNWRPGSLNNQAMSSFMTAAGGSVDSIGLTFYPNSSWQAVQIETFAVWV